MTCAIYVKATKISYILVILAANIRVVSHLLVEICQSETKIVNIYSLRVLDTATVEYQLYFYYANRHKALHNKATQTKHMTYRYHNGG